MAHAPTSDPLRRCWAAVTIRVAWTLYAGGVRPTGQVLALAREHSLLSLPRDIGRLQAEELAEAFTQEYLDRTQRGKYRRPPLPRDPVSPRPSWRERLTESLDPVGEVVLRLVHGDGLSLQEVERITRVDRVVLQGAQEGVRGALRAIMSEDGVAAPIESLSFERLLCRTARLPAADCRGGAEAATMAGAAHAERCPRCARAVRLIRAGALAPSELIAPERIYRPANLSVLALHLHPDARHHRKALVEALGPAAMRADEDTLLINLDRVGDHVSVLHAQALEGEPGKEHVRGAMVRGAGMWTPAGLIGPVGAAAVELTRARSWGEIDSCGTLPDPLPEPPTAARWWSAAGVAVLIAALLGLWTLRPDIQNPDLPVHGVFARGADGVHVDFDTDDGAYLLVLALDADGGVRSLHRSAQLWDKAELATGNGRFAVGDPIAQRLLVASAATPFERVDLLALAQESADPLAMLMETLPKVWPGVDLIVQRHPPALP
ncbi:MAG: hypothetical protein ACI9VR_000566 [Cognaticolwellia sp.]|jgi:hypothetical protein